MVTGSRARAWIDGASRGNPGEAGFGVLFELGDQAHEITGFLGRTTNNVAEYCALVAALTYAAERGVKRLGVRSDSELLVKQLTGEYKVKASHLVPLFLEVLRLKRGFEAFQIRHVRREENRLADRLANRAIDEREPLPAWLTLAL
ncbi:MAG: ribonuclease HI family protein [Thermoanaerobaculia bacterium]